MFSFFHRSSTIHVDCFTAMSNAYKYAPIIPASRGKPEWVNSIEKAQKGNTDFLHYIIDENNMINFNNDPSLRTLRSCYGFLELYKRGFILENWCDLGVHISDDRQISYHYSTGSPPLVHSENQVSPGFKDYYLLKLVSPWRIHSKQDLHWVAIGAEWSLENYMVKVLPGCLNFYYQTSSNLFLAVPKNLPTTFCIPMGHALTHFIPLTEKKVKIHTHLITEDEMRIKQYDITSTTMGWRRTIPLMKRNDERNKKCPFGFGD